MVSCNDVGAHERFYVYEDGVADATESRRIVGLEVRA